MFSTISMRLGLTGLVVCGWFVISSVAAVVFDAARHAIIVSDYPVSCPGSLRNLADADRIFGWGQVEYNADTDAYTVKCDLWIGGDSGADTFFQIGSAEHPRETLVMRGNLLVRPWWLAGRHAAEKWYRVPERQRPVNRLTVGCADDTNVTAKVRLDCQGTNRIGLATGLMTVDGKGGNMYGGELHVYHSALELVNPAPGAAMRENFKLYGPSQHLVHAMLRGWGTVCGLTGMAHYGNVIERSTFRGCGRVIMGGSAFHQCVFEGCRIGLADWGSGAEVLGCVFRDNGRNYTLAYCKQLVAEDCKLGPTRDADTIIMPPKAAQGKDSPAFISRRHVAVLVADESGNPAPGAMVRFTPEQAGSGLLENNKCETDADGKATILLTEYIKTAGEAPDQPAVAVFTYAISAEQGGRNGRVAGVAPDATGKQIQIKLGGET